MIRLTIGNRLIIENASNSFTNWLIDRLTFPNPAYEEAVKQGRYTRNIDQSIKLYTLTPTSIIIPRGLLQTIEENIIRSNVEVEIIDNRVLSPTVYDSNITLRHYQKPATINMSSHPNGMLIAPAGSGKTIMGLNMCAVTGQKTLWITHTIPLCKQVKARILGTDNEDGIPAFNGINESDIGMLGDGKWKIGKQFTVGIPATLVRRPEQLMEISKEFGLVIIDESHHVPSSTFMKVVNSLYSYYLYGLTATPYRRDRLENVMFTIMGKPNGIIKRSDVKKEKGIITPTAIITKVKHDTHTGNDINYILNNLIIPYGIRQDIIISDVMRESLDGNFCIVVSTRKEYCEILYKKISPLTNRVGIATGDYNDKHNDEQVRKLKNKEISIIITTVDLLGEGFDVPHLNRGFISLPFRWGGRAEQVVGRIQRPSEGKTDALLYDYVDEGIGVVENQFISRAAAYKALDININMR